MASYTQRRYFAHAEQRRREKAEPTTPPPDMMLAHSFRASWGPAGTLVFGSRSVRMVQVAPPDAAAGNGGDAESTRQRATATLGVRVQAQRLAAGGDTQPLAELARGHKLATATAASSQAALQEGHAWKLVSALLDGAAHQAGGSAMSEADEALAHVRQREAVCAWLRLSMWDTAAQELQESGSAAARVWSLATSLHATEATRSALAGEDAGDSGCSGGRAYLAAMMACPVGEVQADMQAQLAHWRQHGAPGAAPQPHAEEATAVLPRLFELLAGETAAAEIDISAVGDGRGRQGACGWPQGEWMRAYALRLGFSPDGIAARLRAPAPDAHTPWDALWHALQLGAPRGWSSLSSLPLDRSAFPLCSSLRLRDYSHSYALAHTAAAPLGFRLRGRRAALLQHSYVFQLAALRCWQPMLYLAAQPAAWTGDEPPLAAPAAAELPELLLRLLHRFPPPDELSAATLALLDARPLDEPPPLTRAALELALGWLDIPLQPLHPTPLLCALHTALAWRARAQRRPRAEVRHLVEAASLGAVGLWAEAHTCLVAQLLPPIALSGAREEARGARALLLRLQQAAEGGGPAAVPGWACGGRVYLLYFETLEAEDALRRGGIGAAEVLADGRLEQLLDTAAEAEQRAARRVAEVLTPQLKAQEAGCGCWLPETALELGALAEVRRRVALLAEAVRRQPFALAAV